MFFRTLFIQAQSANLKFKQAYPVTTKLYPATQVSIVVLQGLVRGFTPKTPNPLRIEMGVVMAKKNLKTTYKKLRLTELEAAQIDKYLHEHNVTFTDLVNALIGKVILSEFPTVLPELPKEDLATDNFPRKAKNKSVRQQPKVDPALLFQLGKIGNNINQIAKSLNRIAQQNPTPDFSFLECLHTLSFIQSDVHEVTGELPKIRRSEEAVKKARERAIAKVLNRDKGEVLDVF